MTFGEYVRDRRLFLGIGLRKFCEILEFDSSNWSKVERDRLPVADDRSKLERIAEVLQLRTGSSDWQQFFDLASISQKKIPDDIYSDEDILEVLPVFFRTVRGDKPTEADLDKLIELIKRR